jgi:hypothetical protein
MQMEHPASVMVQWLVPIFCKDVLPRGLGFEVAPVTLADGWLAQA